MEVVELSARLVYRRSQGGRCACLKVNGPPAEVAACLLPCRGRGPPRRKRYIKKIEQHPCSP